MKRSDGLDNHIEPWRLMIFYVILAFVFIFYIFRLFNLQILQGDVYQAYAYENRHTTYRIPTTRGSLFDRNDYILARNVPSYNVVITPALLPEYDGDGVYKDNFDGAYQDIFRQLGELLNIPAFGPLPDEDTVRSYTACISELAISQIVYIAYTNAPYRAAKITCNVSEEIAFSIREKEADWSGVSIEIEPIREYPTGSLTSEVIGFLGPIPAGYENYYSGFEAGRDKVGYAGVEQTLQEILGGKNGLREIEVDAAGQELGDLAVPIQPIPGYDVRLTIDTRLQTAAKTALINQIDYLHATSPEVQESNGVVIAMNPQTGEILALVSYPTFENNRMARIIPEYYYRQLAQDPGKPLFNHAISAEHPPGSVFKMATAIGILNEGVVTPGYKINDPGKISLVQKFYDRDIGPSLDYVCYTYASTNAGHGDVDFLRGVAESCDVYFYKVGGGYKDEVPNGGLGIWRIGEYAKALGYGQTTGIELPGEQDGLIPNPRWKRLTYGENWATGDTYIGTIGQGYVTSTPLQVLQSFATLANDGVMVKPTLIKEILDSEGKVIRTIEPQIVCDITQECEFVCDQKSGDCIFNIPDTDLSLSGKKFTKADPNQTIEMRGVIDVLNDNGDPTGDTKTVAPWVIQMAKEGMRMVVTEGTAKTIFDGMEIQTGGKTGTAEYCDDLARELKICERGAWPAHAWYAGYAPYDDPEIVVVAFVYHGKEGSVIAGPIARKVIEAYYELKEIDATGGID